MAAFAAAEPERSLAAEIADAALVVDPVEDAEPARRGRAPRRRGGRAAGAPQVTAEPSAPSQELTAPAATEAAVTTPVVDANGAAGVEGPGAGAPDSADSPAAPKKAAAPRRRRAASRPAGPASAPAPITGG
jgi:ribonuclease E